MTLACGPSPPAGDGGTTTDPSSSSGPGESEDHSGSEDHSEPGDPTFTTHSFVPPDDIEELPSCDPFAQDCPEGEKCVPYSSTGGNWDANKCVPVLGDREPGEPCHYSDTVEASDDCDATSFCWHVMEVAGELIGTCAPFCTGTADNPQCPEGPGCFDYTCLIAGSSSLNPCVLGCDPLAQDCGEELGCFWANGSFQCVFTTQDIPIGEPCGYINDCAAGNICTEARLLPDCPDDACCTAFCDPAALVDPCPELLPGTGCVVFEEADASNFQCAVGRCLASP